MMDISFSLSDFIVGFNNSELKGSVYTFWVDFKFLRGKRWFKVKANYLEKTSV